MSQELFPFIKMQRQKVYKCTPKADHSNRGICLPCLRGSLRLAGVGGILKGKNLLIVKNKFFSKCFPLKLVL